MEQPFLQQASVQDVSDFPLQHNNKLFRLFLSLWTLCWLARTSHRPISRTVWLKVPLLCKTHASLRSPYSGMPLWGNDASYLPKVGADNFNSNEGSHWVTLIRQKA
eukprot:1137935-Pelagomonas_calceolata.AAC.3